MSSIALKPLAPGVLQGQVASGRDAPLRNGQRRQAAAEVRPFGAGRHINCNALSSRPTHPDLQRAVASSQDLHRTILRPITSAAMHFADRSEAFSIVVGAKVFVCDNLALSGDVIAIRRKHTAGFDLNATPVMSPRRSALHQRVRRETPAACG